MYAARKRSPHRPHHTACSHTGALRSLTTESTETTEGAHHHFWGVENKDEVVVLDALRRHDQRVHELPAYTVGTETQDAVLDAAVPLANLSSHVLLLSGTAVDRCHAVPGAPNMLHACRVACLHADKLCAHWQCATGRKHRAARGLGLVSHRSNTYLSVDPAPLHPHCIPATLPAGSEPPPVLETPHHPPRGIGSL